VRDWEGTLEAALRQQWKRYRRALQRCQRHFSEEAVHDSRVQCRRLLAQVELLGVLGAARDFKKARAELKDHLDTFDELRDTQVLLLLLEQQTEAFPETRPLRQALQRREKRCLVEAARGIRTVKTSRVKQFVTDLRLHLAGARVSAEQRGRERRAILQAIDQAFGQVVERRGEMDPGNVATIHRTRVAFKKFRYMVEVLHRLVPGISAARLEAMQGFQTLFGDLQDTDVFLGRLDKFARKDRQRARTLAALRHWLLKRRTAQIDACLRHADMLLEFWPPRRTARPAANTKPRKAP
jgi:CHAD domain-containing protein